MSTLLMPSALIRQAANRFRILSVPSRLELINLLHVNGECTVQSLVDRSGQSQPSVSKHLLLMSREGILNRRKIGLKVYYSIADASLAGVCLLVCGQIQSQSQHAIND